MSIVVLIGVNDGPAEEGVERFKRFAALGPVHNASGMIPYAQLNGKQDVMVPHGLNRLNKGAYSSNFDKDHLMRVHGAWKTLVTDYPCAIRSVFICEMYNHEKIGSIPSDATAFPGRHADYGVFMVMVWTDEELTPKVHQISKDIFDTFTDASAGFYGNANDVECGGGEVQAKALFGANYERLVLIKRKHDPENIFNKWFAITPAAA